MFAIVIFAEATTKTIKIIDPKWIKRFNVKKINFKKCYWAFYSENSHQSPNFEVAKAKNLVPNQERIYKIFVKKIVGEFKFLFGCKNFALIFIKSGKKVVNKFFFIIPLKERIYLLRVRRCKILSK